MIPSRQKCTYSQEGLNRGRCPECGGFHTTWKNQHEYEFSRSHLTPSIYIANGIALAGLTGFGLVARTETDPLGFAFALLVLFFPACFSLVAMLSVGGSKRDTSIALVFTVLSCLCVLGLVILLIMS